MKIKKALLLVVALSLIILNYEPVCDAGFSIATTPKIEDELIDLEISYLSNESEEKCYGLLIPLPPAKNTPYTSIQQSVANMVNDLLRMNITVYWAASNFTASSMEINELTGSDHFYEKGTFIIPFTGDLVVDALILSVAHDYKSSSEIEEYYPIEIHHLLEPLTLQTYPLKRVKAAYHFCETISLTDLLWYLYALQSGGFLDNRILLDVAEELNNDDFNLFIWPGGVPRLKAKTYIETGLDTLTYTVIRRFVENGGGYVGSCYGALSASSGEIIPFNFLQSYFKKLPVALFLALVPSSVCRSPCASFATVKLLNMSHPTAFGVEKVQKTFYWGGPVFLLTNITPNVQPLAVLKNVEIERIRSQYENLPLWLIERWANFLLDKPIWIASRFGKGKVVVFGDHPESNLPTGHDRLIHNTLFYTTAEPKTTTTLDRFQLFSKIKTTYLLTDDLYLPDHIPIFKEIWNETILLERKCRRIDDLEKNLFSLASELMEEGKIDVETCVKIYTIYHDSYQQWLNKFSHGLMKLERVYSRASRVGNIPISTWRNTSVEELKTCNYVCTEALELLDTLVNKLERYIGSSAEELSILKLAKKLDLFFRKGYSLFTRLWPETVKLYREIWYRYEAQQPSNVVSKEVTSNGWPSKKTLCLVKESPKILFVDDDASAGGNGSLTHPYKHIQDAIDAASDGDTIIVHEGIYYEHLIVGKSVRILGNNKAIIDGEKKMRHIIMTVAPYVEISGFTIQNSPVTRSVGICLYSSNNIITGNIFKNNCIGIGLGPKSKNNIIKDNYAVNNSYIGIIIDEIGNVNNTISGNIIKDNGCHGLYLLNVDNEISNNVFINNSIMIPLSQHNYFAPEIKNNTVDGKSIYCYKNKCNFIVKKDAGQLILSNCTNVTIKNVHLSTICIIGSSNVRVKNSTISDDLIGISLQSAKNVTIANNLIKNNSWSGIWLYNSSRNNISSNSMDSNDEGIILSSLNENRIENNVFTRNVVGVFIQSSSMNNKICSNNFKKNHQNSYAECRNQWENNYWDDWVGLRCKWLRFLPYHIPGSLIYNFDWNPKREPYAS